MRLFLIVSNVLVLLLIHWTGNWDSFGLIRCLRVDLGMAALERVPCVNVGTDNFERLWPTIKEGIESAVFVALDLVSFGSHVE